MVLRCLIVDDNDHFLRAARWLLEREGITVVGIPSTCSEALARFEECRPDVTLVDVQLGEENGLDLARRLAGGGNGDGGGGARVILISTYPERDLTDVLAQCPSVGFLSKSDLSAAAIHEILGRAAHDHC
ncbi:response regulator transcription factor [Nonomuraea jiangxiensis]|uniref:CheY chemotaxis protein or a CheY-like REC (Receiver) domain n=1 Tax=Nonomuraea jiangxiensis TaxID=633440 RepID=A0A1G8W6T8_9ACTN|nr:response regulator [Nonomuraea jiangxiensis]SDJ74002.1 CheY chemotaxis protein or a CheY-like REC (receiver) domain [Nonomuraea jiangxiensis]